MLRAPLRLSSQGGGDKDGYPTLVRIRDAFASRLVPMPPVVILSGESDAAEVAKYVDAGAARVVLKPATQDGLRALSALAAAHREAPGSAGGGNGNGHSNGVGNGAAAAAQQPRIADGSFVVDDEGQRNGEPTWA